MQIKPPSNDPKRSVDRMVPSRLPRTLVASSLVLVTAGMLSTSFLPWLKPAAPYTVHVTLALLAAGMFFFMTGRNQLMMTSLFCCVALSLFRKSSANHRLRLAAASDPAIRLAHVNLSNAEGDYDTVIHYLRNLPGNLISIQELTPDWEPLLREELRERYPYQVTLTRLDPYGCGLFSALPFQAADTLWMGELPALRASLDIGSGQSCEVITTQAPPPVNAAAYSRIASHFRLLAETVNTTPGYVLIAGDFHLPAWSTEVRELKREADLEDSRRDVHTRNLDGSVSLPRIPVDHILYGPGLDCASFANIGNEGVGRLGIMGSYLPRQDHAKVAQ